jgi:hypothetical protein
MTDESEAQLLMTGPLDKMTDPDGDNHQLDCLLIDRYPDVALECKRYASVRRLNQPSAQGPCAVKPTGQEG